ncbi:tyrosine-type recombinase/integrase [Pararhodobacter sp. CCB-MM2]|uniref:tyrosine-type recombinase/integrase n=1 Tax=Pararhodobacter sp. CCB-MM2 TaxID=1786003 RepID=UPI00082DBF92
MLPTIPRELRGARDRAMLLIGFAGGLRRSELVGFDHGRDDTINSAGWVQVVDEGLLLTLRRKTGWREVEIARGSAPETCPATALSHWLNEAQIDFGPLFTAVSRDDLRSTGARLSDKHVARLVKSCAETAGLDPRQYSAHSLRAGLDKSAKAAGPCFRQHDPARSTQKQRFPPQPHQSR